MKIAYIAWVSLRRTARDRTALIFMLLLPVVITLVVGVAIFGAANKISVGLVQQGDGPLAVEIATGLRAVEDFDVTAYGSETELQRAIRRDQQTAGVVIPRGYDEALEAGRDVSVRFVVNPTRNAPAAVRETVSALVTSQAKLVQAARFATENGSGDFQGNLEAARRINESQPGPLTVETSAAGTRGDVLPGGFGYTAPANLVLSVFITSLVAGGILIESRRLGITRRMLGTPTSAGTILVGEMAGRFVVSMVQALILVLAGTFLFDVDYGDPLTAMVLLVFVALVATAIAMLVGTVFRTPEQAASVGPPIGIGLGMLGGCMWPLEIVGPTMAKVGHLFPQAWAMDGFIKLVARDARVADIGLEIGVLAAFTVVLLTLGTLRLRRVLVA